MPSPYMELNHMEWKSKLVKYFDLMNPIGGDINSNLFFTYPLSNKDLKI